MKIYYLQKLALPTNVYNINIELKSTTLPHRIFELLFHIKKWIGLGILMFSSTLHEVKLNLNHIKRRLSLTSCKL